MRTHTEYECNLCFLKVIEMKEGMKETGVMLDHELHIPDSLQPLNTAISPVLKHPFFSFIGLLFVLFLAPSLPVVTDEHNARKIYSNSCPHKRKRTKLLSARCADSKNIFLSVEQNSKFAHIQKEKKTTLQLLIVWVWGLPWSIVWRRQMSIFHHAVINRSFNGVNDDFVCVPLF